MLKTWLCALPIATRAQWAVTVALVPASLFWFYQVPIVGPMANAFAIPWASFLITPMTLAGALLPSPVDAWVWRFAHLNLVWMMAALDWLAAPEWAVLWLRAPGNLSFALAILGAACALAPAGWPGRRAGWLLWLPLGWPGDTQCSEGAYRVTVLDVGQGSAIVVQTRSHVLVFDTGPRYGTDRDAGRAIVVPALTSLGVRRIDRLIVSHADADHAGGAASTAAALKIASLRASLDPRDPLWSRVREQHAEQGFDDDAAPQAVEHDGNIAHACEAGERWEWDGVRFEMLWPLDSDDAQASTFRNASSCVLRISNGHASALFPGDIEAAQERRLVSEYGRRLQADLLVAPHHGSRTSSTESFLDSIAARHVIFGVGYRNRFGHPHSGIVARYAARGVQSYRSDLDGAVRATSLNGPFVFERCRRVHHRYWMDE